MPIKIEIQESHVQLLIDFYIARLKILREEIQDRERETKEINTAIQRLKKREIPLAISSIMKVDNKSSYSEKWPWLRKVQFALENQAEPLTTKEIVEVLTEYEPSFLFDRKRAVASVSSILSTKSGSEFIRVDSESGDFAYRLRNDKNNKGNELEDPFGA
ncbi:MAG TPA: hypothetical protein VFE32_07525 [Puia sp.]|jgi:predicted Zn-ribbon and HTH transcriptional regulator|nr:hypothetical protein [Puia sp.]